jgi:hypothetical protein
MTVAFLFIVYHMEVNLTTMVTANHLNYTQDENQQETLAGTVVPIRNIKAPKKWTTALCYEANKVSIISFLRCTSLNKEL